MAGIGALHQTSQPASSVASFGNAETSYPSNRIIGPGEGLNHDVDDTTFTASTNKIAKLGEGSNQYVDNTNFAANGGRITGPGEGLTSIATQRATVATASASLAQVKV